MGKQIIKSARDLFKDYLSREEIDVMDIKVNFSVAISLFMLDNNITVEEMADLMGVDTEVLEVLIEGNYEKLTVKGEDKHE